MKPYYHDEKAGITLYCGDCLELLPQFEAGSVDITVSSPPYNQIAATKPSGIFTEHTRKQNAGYDRHGDNMSEPAYQQWMRDVFEECRRLSLGLVWVNHKTRFRDGLGIHPLSVFPWQFHSEIIWDRGGSLTLNAKRYAPSHEVVYGFGSPHYWSRVNDTTRTVWRIIPERNVPGHPCPFPVEIPLRCITSSCPEGGSVIDPFAGSGTTLVAAKRLGRHAIGIELSERYCEIAVNRLRNEPMPLFDDTPTEIVEQKSLFAEVSS